jgi:hypothetical protein
MILLLIYFSLFFILPSSYFLFILYSDFIASRDQILLISKEIHVLQEKQNVLISEIQKLTAQVTVIDSASSTYFTNSNIFYGFVGLSVLIILGLVLYNWGSGDTAGLIIDVAERQNQFISDCNKLLCESILKFVVDVSTINMTTQGSLSEQLFRVQFQILCLDHKIDMLAHSAGLSAGIPNEFVRAMQANPGVFFGYS